jgi:hypothetical protein
MGVLSRLLGGMSGESPNPISVGWSVLNAMRKRRPRPSGAGRVEHSKLAGLLDTLQQLGVAGLAGERTRIGSYRKELADVDPDELTPNDALAYWLNLYNAGALDVAAAAAAQMATSVLRIPGAFRKPWVTVAGEELSLDAIEHGKIRRFKDPRIHSALVCGSASCPTLRYEPYRGDDLDRQLDEQMRSFLTGGGASYDPDTNRLLLSRVFLWYGADFVRPHRMPTWLPASKRAVATALGEWLDPAVRGRVDTAAVAFQSYDWGLACSIG